MLFINLASWIAVGGVIIAISCFFTLDKRAFGLVPDFGGPSSYIPVSAISVAMLFYAIDVLGELSSHRGGISQVMKSGDIHLILSLISALLALVAAFGLFVGTVPLRRIDALRAICSMGAAVFMAVYAMCIYTNSATPINSHPKIVETIAFLVASAFFMQEARLSLGRDMWRGYFAFGMAGGLLAAFASIPSIIFYFVKGSELSEIYGSVILLTVFIYITAGLVRSLTLRPDAGCPIADAIRGKDSQEREDGAEEEKADI